MDFVVQPKQMFRQVAAVLARNSGNQRFLFHMVRLSSHTIGRPAPALQRRL
jgi:hypothetical protein